jgi:hypothetical protein
MKHTGNENYQLFQAWNFKLEHVSIIPTFGPEQIGRIFFVPGIGVVAGLESGFVVLSNGGGGSSNGLCIFTFKYWLFNTRSPIVVCYDALGNDTKIYPPSSGKLSSIEILSSNPITAGFVKASPSINGVVIPEMELILNSGNPSRSFFEATVTHSFVLGSFLEVSLTGDPVSEPQESNITVNLTIKT